MVSDKGTLVLTVKELNYFGKDGITILDSIRGIDWRKYGVLVFNSVKESETETIGELTKIREMDIKIIYIARDISTLWYYIFSGLGSDIYDDIAYLEDFSILEYLIKKYHDNKDMTVKAPTEGAEALEKFLNLFKNSSEDEIIKTINNKLWLQSLNSAVTNIHNSLIKSNSIGTEVMGLVCETNKLIKSLEQGQINTANELITLQKLVQEMQDNIASPNSNTGNSLPFIYNKYIVPLTVKNVLYVRVVGTCMHLNSFLIAYQHYLKMRKQYNSKILLMMPKLKLNLKRYQNFSNLSSDSIGLTGAVNSPIAVTFEPTKNVLDAWFKSGGKTDLYIVVDYLKDSVMIEGHMAHTMYGISSISDLKLFGIKPEKAFIALTGYKENFMIPFISKYRDVPEQTKKSMYYENCKNLFERLDNVLFKN